MHLTKTQAIAEHRKMWNWIADQVEQGIVVQPVYLLKKEYLKDTPYHKELIANCFLCEYAGVCSDSCRHCPVVHENKNNRAKGCLGGLYDELVYVIGNKCYLDATQEDRQYAVQLCRKIANLPERPDMPGDILE